MNLSLSATLTTTDTTQAIWNDALGLLQLEIPRPNFETWLKDTSAKALEGDKLIVSAPSAFVAEMLEQRLSGSISRIVERVAGRPMSVEFSVGEGQGEGAASHHVQGADADPSNGKKPRKSDSGLRPDLTFDTFVVGDSNSLAHAAAANVADAPGRAYNPLYIYSNVGLGKTHLLHAICHALLQKGIRALYVSSERFTNEFIRAIRAGSADKFREHYRSAEALLVDDIQFIASKEQTQEGFFHTFNELHMSGRQVVVTGDEPARKSLLEERIQSRLEGGLVVDIQPPNFETRIAILQSKAQSSGVDIPLSVLDMLAHRLQSNIRELEGSLNRVVAYAQLVDSAVTPELARQALNSLAPQGPARSVDPKELLDAVANHTGISVDSLKGPRRDKLTAQARHFAMYLLREESHLPSTRIGELLGGKDHSSVLYAQRKVSQQLATDPSLRQELDAIVATLMASKR